MKAASKIVNYTMHGSLGKSVKRNEWVEWVLAHKDDEGATLENGYGLGSVTHYTWEVDGKIVSFPSNFWMYSAAVLPDGFGFIGFEDSKRSDNLVLLDAYGQERMRLGIPWQLTREPTPHSADYPSRFIGLTSPWNNPATGELGKFAVLAWVEYAGDYAFELDWTTGQFLWGHHLERY